MSFHIVADSCCELTADMKKRGNIEIAPLTLEVGGAVSYTHLTLPTNSLV